MGNLDGAPASFLLATDRTEIATLVQMALRAAGIPHESGLQAVPSPRLVITVPESRLEDARAVVARCLGQRFLSGELDERPGKRDDDEDDEEAAEHLDDEGAEPHRPWGPLGACAGLMALHGAILLAVGSDAPSPRLAEAGALVHATALREPWRFVTYAFLHSDARHILWNGLSLAAFAVPLLGSLGYARTALVYLVSAVAGGLTAVAAYPAWTVTVGSSGAVAGLFGAWLARTLRRVRRAPPAKHAKLKVIGIGLLVLPSLLTPTRPGGGHISVAAHLGGAAAGVILGLLLPTPGSAPVEPEVH